MRVSRGAVLLRALQQALPTAALHGPATATAPCSAPAHGRIQGWLHIRTLSSLQAMRDSPEKLGPFHRYEWMVQHGLIQHDAQQHIVAQMLESLLSQMKDYQKEMEKYQTVLRKWVQEREQQKKVILKEQAVVEAQKRLQRIAQENRRGIWGWWSRKTRHARAEPGAGRLVARIKREKKLASLVGPRPPLPPSPQGLYLYGNVGCGKTFLMDMFFHACHGTVRYCRRVHFHAAMLEVHDRMHKLWKRRRRKVSESELGKSSSSALSESLPKKVPVTLEMAAKEWLEEEEHWEAEHESDLSAFWAVADEFVGDMEGDDVGGASLLCFDEVQVVDVFTAVALSAILSRLLSRGTVIVATSNRAPQDLNKDGLQKQIFTAFVTKLEQHCRSVLVGLDKDYRRVLASLHNSKDRQVNYFWPLGTHSSRRLDQQWNDIVQHPTATATYIPVMFGRVLEVPQSYFGVARFSFEELCNRPLGAADYVSIAQNYHTVFVTDVPVMSRKNSDKARRFITLVDELYNHHCRLVCTTAAAVDELFLGTEEGALIDLESLQFETEAEGSRLRRDVLVAGSVAPLAGTNEGKSSIEALLSGREELFAFRRAVSRMIEMESPTYLEALRYHPTFQTREVSKAS